VIGPSGYTSLDAIARANTQKADEPTFFEKVKNFFGGGDDKPTPVAGGRGRTVERPNERSDYLAKILDDQFAPVPPASYEDARTGLRANQGYLDPSGDSGLKIVQSEQPDYSGNYDRYSIPVGKYIPSLLRPTADALGLTDLSNLNPMTTLFMRPRDAAARYVNPEKYSPTGKRETMDLVEAAMGPVEALLGVGLGKYLGEPIEQGLGSLFGLNVDLGAPVKTGENLRLYHGSPQTEFMPEEKYIMPDGSVGYSDMFQVAGGQPGDTTTMQSGLYIPSGAQVTETYPYGRMSTDYVGTGEGRFDKGSDDAKFGSQGALAGKGVYFASNPNIAQYYRYSHNKDNPYIPYELSRNDFGQRVLEEVQPQIIKKYGSLENAKKTYLDEGFSIEIDGKTYDAQSPKKIKADSEKEYENLLQQMGNNKYLSNFVQKEKIDPMEYGRNYKIPKNYQGSLDTGIISIMKGDAARKYAEKPFELNMKSTLENVKSRIEEIQDIMNKDITKDQNNKDNTFPVFLFESTTSDKDVIKALKNSNWTNSEIAQYTELKNLKNLSEKYSTLESLLKQTEKSKLEQNKIIENLFDTDLKDIPGSLLFADISEADLGKSLDLGNPMQSFVEISNPENNPYLPPTNVDEIPGQIDIGTLNDMVDIFGTNWVNSRLAGMTEDQWRFSNLNKQGNSYLEKTGNAALPYRVKTLINKRGNLSVPTESLFKPINTDEMNKLADAGYTNLRFLDATARTADSNKPSFNYVFFDDMIMPKIVDKKKDGGLISMGLGSV